MTTERACRDCGEPIGEGDTPPDLDEPRLCDRCSSKPDLSPETTTGHSRRARLIAVAVGLAGATVAFIGVTIARQRREAEQDRGRYDDEEDEDPYGGLADLFRAAFGDDDDLDDSCEECGDKVWIHYCPQCHRSDD